MGNQQDRMTLINNKDNEEKRASETIDYVTRPKKDLKLGNRPTQKGLSEKRWSKNRRVNGKTNLQNSSGNCKRNSTVCDGGNLLWETRIEGFSPIKTYGNRKKRRLTPQSLNRLGREESSRKVEKWLEKTHSSDPLTRQETEEEEENSEEPRSDVPNFDTHSEPSTISKCSEISRFQAKSSPPKSAKTKEIKITAPKKKRKKRKRICMPVPKRKTPKSKVAKKESHLKGKPLAVKITPKTPKVKLNKDGELTFRKDSFYRYHLRNRGKLSDEKGKRTEKVTDDNYDIEEEETVEGLEGRTTTENSEISDLWLNEVCDEKNSNSKNDDEPIDDNGETPPMENQKTMSNPSKRKLFSSKRFLNLVEEVCRERQQQQKEEEEEEDLNEVSEVSTCFLERSAVGGFAYDSIFVDRSLRYSNKQDSGVSDCLFSSGEDV